MASSNPVTVTVRKDKGKRALLLIHGFGGNSQDTFGMFPAFLAGDPDLYDWDIYCIGYPTGLSPDITGVWAADPDLTALSGYLQTVLARGLFAEYGELTLLAHSMGGLIVQRAILDGAFEERLRHVFLFGTPSNGLRKAWLGKIFKRQARDMTHGGEFVTQLRKDWNDRYGTGLPFRFLAVAGLEDQFVGPETSVAPFPPDLHVYVTGNHLRMVKPEQPDSDNTMLVRNELARGGASKPIATTQSGSAPSGGERTVVNTARATERAQGTQKAVEFLESMPMNDTDTLGALAGMLKRLWLADPVAHSDSGHRAFALYRQGREQASKARDWDQAYYHGINVAFLWLALHRLPLEARRCAATVLEDCAKAPASLWRSATEGEARLYLGRVDEALRSYAAALGLEPEPHERESMNRQALWAARLLDDDVAEMRLNALFAAPAAPAADAGIA
ncbi:MAG: alpha/beta hydrolase [Bryobacteraceae bacterium]